VADERPAGYGRRVIDLDQGWRTERLDLEPLTVGHAAELAPALDDAALHEFTGGAPLSPAALTARYARLAKRRSPDGDQLWGNWVGVQAQGRGYAKEAASGLVALLRADGWTVIAHIHPAHLASQRVARAAGLSPTGEVHDGEVRWAVRPGCLTGRGA
jgi:hypothetical protein